MILCDLAVQSFRIHNNSTIDFSEGLNFIVGGNGEGKTTIIEAIYFLCTTKNFKGAPDSELLKFGNTSYTVSGTFSNAVPHSVTIYYSAEDEKRQYVLNGKKVHRTTEVIGKFPVVLLTPDDHQLTQGAPGERRKFIDSAISQADHSYLLSLIEYTKILKQRSALLNLLRENRRKEYLNELDAWDAQLVRYGARLVNIRYSFIEEFRRYVEEAYRQIMDTREIPSIDYQMPGGMNRTISEDEFLRSLNSRREDEIRRGMNLTGPHRDDFVFLVNDKPLKVFGSQGQHKTFQIALRFAEYFYLKEKSATAPIFLLDDVFGELDTRRALKISAYLEMIAQAFITITDFSNYRFLNEQSSGKIIRIEQGAVHYG